MLRSTVISDGNIIFIYTHFLWDATKAQSVLLTSPHQRRRALNINYHAVSSEQVNRLTPNDLYMSPTTPLTSKRCILYIYSTNIGTEYFFSSKCSLFHNANLFGSCIIHILHMC